MAGTFQTVKDVKVNRNHHVWINTETKWFKCVICGGISIAPDTNGSCDKYEQLTDEERKLCPPQK